MSDIDGRKVRYMNREDWVGQVIGDSHTEGFVRVHWEPPHPQISAHRIGHLTLLDEAPTQEDLSNQYYARGTDGKNIPLQES